MRCFLAIASFASVVASQMFAATAHGPQSSLAEVFVPNRDHKQSPLLRRAAELGVTQHAKLGEPARIDPAKAEDQYAQRHPSQSQRIEEKEPESQPRIEEEQPEETTSEFLWRWWDMLSRYFWRVLFSMSLYLFLVILIAIFYRHKLMDRRELDGYAQLDDFSSRLFACHEDIPICFWACCCPAIRWGDTVGKMQWMGFWPAFFLFLLMTILTQVFTLAGLTLFIWFFFSLLLAHYRTKFRQSLNFAEENACFLDTLVYCFCQCCAISQEARHVKALLKAEMPS